MLSLLARSRRRHRSSGDGPGFTLIETVVALAIATSVFLALAAAAITGMRASLTSQQNQQAGDLITQTIEQVRDMDYGADGLQIASTDPSLATDTALTACASASHYCYDPNVGTGAEALQVSATGQITSHKQTVTANNTPFTVYIYVTRPGAAAAPADAYGADYERVTVVTSWTTFGKTHSRRSSTYVTNSMRGLPLPRYRFTNTNATSQAFNPQSRVVFGMRIQNLGARDCWTLTTSDPAFVFYLDDGDGAYDAGDTILAACPGTGSTLLEPAKASPIIWAMTVLPGTPGPYTKQVTFTATSWAQPTASTATHSVSFAYVVQNTPVTATPTVTPTTTGTATPSPAPTTVSPSPTTVSPTPTTTASPTVCSDLPSASIVGNPPKGYTAIGHYLHNVFPNNADSSAQSQLGFNKVAPVSTWLYDYGKDLAAGTPGRYLAPGGAGATETAVSKVIDWRLQMSKQISISGDATLTAWAEPANGDASAQGTVKVYVNTITGGTVTALANGVTDASPWGCVGFRKFGVKITLPTTTVKNNAWIDVRMEISSTTPMIIAYDTTAFPALFAVPEG